MSYKIDPEKGFKILRCISPPVILINDVAGIGNSEMAVRFKKEGYSILNAKNMNAEQVQKYLSNRKEKSFDHNSLIMEFGTGDDKLISDIFSGEFHNFTYVFLYPNNAKLLKEKLREKISGGGGFPEDLTSLVEQIKKTKVEQEKEKLLTKLTVETLKIVKEIYGKHLETFDDKILTILM